MSIEDDLRDHQAREDSSDACPHDSGTRVNQYDADGCGYYMWICDECGKAFFDDLP